MMGADADYGKLNLLRISLALTGSEVGPGVTFDIRIAGEQRGLLRASAEEIGLPLTLSQAREWETSERAQHFHVPDYVLTALESVVPQNGDPLWLSLVQPYGYLPIVPWERLLRPRLICPFLRLPYQEVSPIALRTTIDAIVCFSFPRAKRGWLEPEQVIDQFVRQLPMNLGTNTTLHFFADHQVQPILQNCSQRLAGSYKFEFHDPQKAADYAIPDRSGDDSFKTDLENPWLLWIRDSLTGTSADVVHFVCHGYLGREQGSLAFSQSPILNEDPSWSRFVGARQLCRFLDQVGAWSVSFSSMPGNYSVAGLRFLQEQVAQMRCGPILLHDMEQDDDEKALGQAFRYLYEVGELPAPTSPALSLYCPPDWDREPSTSATVRARQLVDQFSLGGRPGPDVLRRGKDPAFVANLQRSLESQISRLNLDPGSDEERATQRGAEDALRFTSDVVARHLAEWRKGKA